MPFVKSTAGPVYLVVWTHEFQHFRVGTEPVEVPDCREVTEMLAAGRLRLAEAVPAAPPAASTGARRGRPRKRR